MKMLVVLLGILVVPFLALAGLAGAGVIPWQPATYARVSLALLFAFTGLGHFLQTEGMATMIPPRVPMRRAIILVSGVLELALAGALLVSSFVPWSGAVAMAFLVLVFPLNVYAALTRAPYGGHADGPRYLIPRGALQVVLLVWAYFAAVAPAASG